MPDVKVKDFESFEVSMRRFKRLCEKIGIMTRLRQLEFYEKPTWERKRKRSAAKKRYAKQLQKEQEILTRGKVSNKPKKRRR